MYTCIVVDDQLEAVDLITDHVLKTPKLSLSFSTTDAVAALAYLDKQKPDVIFLDIEMPELSGIEFLENIKSRWGNDMPKVVFTTGYGDYALSGYEYGVCDYILKPVSFSRFKKCIDRMIDELDKRSGPVTPKPDFFFVEEDGRKVKINFEDLIYIEAAGNYVVLIMHEFRKTIYKSMNAMQELLPCDKFMRIHKSYIIALHKIKAIRGNEVTILANGIEKSLPVGITYKEKLELHLGIRN
jgi:two-component system, LytTR family, response regulator